MLLVKTIVKKSTIHGLGLFADEFIPKGTVTWRYDHNDPSFTETDINKMSIINRDFVVYYSYFYHDFKKFVLPIDNLRYINHSKDVNRINIDSQPNIDIANKDIYPGEEMLCDYNKFDSNYFLRIGISPEKLN